MHKSNFLQFCNASVSFCKLENCPRFRGDKWGYDLTTPKGEISSVFYTKETPTAEGLLTGFQRHIACGDTALLEGLCKLFTKKQIEILKSLED